MRIGIIGLGRIGAFHAGNLAALDAVDELVAPMPCPASPSRWPRRCTRRWWPTASTNCALVCGRPGDLGLHRHPPAPAGSSRGRRPSGLLRKPIAEDPYAAGDLVEQVVSSGVPVQIGFPRRFDPAFQSAKSALDAESSAG